MSVPLSRWHMVALMCSFLPLFSASHALAQRSCIPNLLIDPGHGGTDASQGYNLGTTCASGVPCTERQINLDVALHLGSILESYSGTEGQNFWYTRKTDAKVFNMERADLAESLQVDQFISIHHDGSTDTSINWSRMYWCSTSETPHIPPRTREVTSLLAQKVGYKIRDTLHFELKAPLTNNELTVLLFTTMPSVLSEAAFITHRPTAVGYAYGDYVEQEAAGIYLGLCSYILNGGIAIVQNSYSSGGVAGIGGSVFVDGVEWNSPFVSAWGEGESHSLWVPYETDFPDGATRTFYRWVHVYDWLNRRDTTSNIEHYEPLFGIGVPQTQLGYHPYLAFYRGGSYSANVYSPEGDTIYVGEQTEILNTCDPGADSSSVLTVWLDRNGGNSGYPETVVPTDYFDEIRNIWTVTGPATNNARLKIIASDYAGNADTATTPETFVIRDCGTLEVGNPTLATIKPAIDTLYISYACNKDHDLTLMVYRLTGGVWSPVDTPFIAAEFDSGVVNIAWEIDQAHQGEYGTYRVASVCEFQCGSTGPHLVDSLSVVLTIQNESPEIMQQMFFEGGVTCLEYDDQRLVRLVAYDPEDKYGLTYHWAVSRGFLGNGFTKDSITANSYMLYNAPGGPPQGELMGPETYSPDTIWVTVHDAHSGQSLSTILFDNSYSCSSPPDCDCGAHGDIAPAEESGGDGYADALDIGYMIDLVFFGGAPDLWWPTCPVSRGDVNCSGVVDATDLSLLIDHVFFGQSICEPCSQ